MDLEGIQLPAFEAIDMKTFPNEFALISDPLGLFPVGISFGGIIF